MPFDYVAVCENHDEHCDLCGGLMDGSEYYDDICDECAIKEGLLSED